ncbi:MAG: hypothetical protein QHJ73_09955 [Armatimonadota bacterium]|nr:hypothetical protein [Armatimonadota bacterium]
MHKRKPLRRWAAAAAALILLAPVLAQNALVQRFTQYHAVVDWASRKVTVQGYAPLKKGASPAAVRRAREAALSHARRNLINVATVIVPITGDQKRRTAMVNEVLKAAARAPVKETRLPDGRLQVTMVATLAGKGGLNALLASYLRQPQVVALLSPAELAVRGGVPPETGEEELLTPPDAKGPFTGLIVDGRGYGVQTSMSPVLYDANNKEVYAGRLADEEFAIDIGVVGYAPTIKAAKALPRVGKNPLILRAVGSPDEFHRCLSLSEEDARRLAEADKASGFLKKCAVVWVVERKD